MNRFLYLALAVLIALSTASCASKAPPASVSASAPEAVVFTDAALEAKVRLSMGRAQGAVTAQEAAAVTELDLSNEWQPQIPDEEKICDIGALASFTGLSRLNLNFNDIADIGPLAGLTQLQYLDLGGNRVEDLSALANLTQLRGLALFGNGITDIGALSGLTDMDSLFIHSNQISDLSALTGMKRLDLLMAQDNRIADLSPLAQLSPTRLYLAGNPIADFGPIEPLIPRLAEKDFELLSAEEIDDEPIVFADAAFEKALRGAMGIFDRPVTRKDAYLTQSLVVHNDKTPGSQFSDIGPLMYFVNLKSLAFNANLISDLTPLAGLEKLTELDVGFNRVTDLTPLARLTQLESLKLPNNQIEDVGPLSGMAHLRELWLRDNPIADFRPLAEIFPQLQSRDFELS